MTTKLMQAVHLWWCVILVSVVGRATGFLMIDQPSRLVLYASPKGGATVATQTMFRYLDILGKAEEYDPWIHKYRTEVFQHQPEHLPEAAQMQQWQDFQSCSICRRDGWTCLKLVRTPLDRAVSSYIHVMKYGLRKIFDATLDSDASFGKFVEHLPMAPMGGPYVDHYTPQSVTGCDDVDGEAAPSVMHIPVECLNDALQQFEKATGIAGLADPGEGSGHYIAKEDVEAANASQWPFEKVRSHTPSYDNFLTLPSVQLRVCSYYHRDVSLYRRACAEPWLQASRKCKLSCAAQLTRLQAVCG